MSRVYDLWDLESGNIINTYTTRAEALTAVRDLSAVNDPAYDDGLSLGYEDGDEQGVIADGAALAAPATAESALALPPWPPGSREATL